MERKTSKDDGSKRPCRTVISEKVFNRALVDAGGLVKYACKILGISYARGWKLLGKYKSSQEVIRQARQAALDTAEYGLRSHLDKQKPWAIQFMLKYQGKERGYVDSKEVESNTNVAIKDILSASDDELLAALSELGVPDDEGSKK